MDIEKCIILEIRFQNFCIGRNCDTSCNICIRKNIDIYKELIKKIDIEKGSEYGFSCIEAEERLLKANNVNNINKTNSTCATANISCKTCRGYVKEYITTDFKKLFNSLERKDDAHA